MNSNMAVVAALRTGLNINRKHPLEALHPGHWGAQLVAIQPLTVPARHNQRPMLEIGRKHTMKAGQVKATDAAPVPPVSR